MKKSSTLPKKIDVVMLTKNSEEILEKCLDSLYKNVPVKRLIIVDGFSQDRTIDILENYNKEYSNIKIIQDSGTRATARQKGIKAVKTKWFMFLDSDIILCKDWFKKASNYIKENVGMIWGVNIDVVPGLKSELFFRAFKKFSVGYFKIRGGLHDTLLLLDAVKDIKIPSSLHCYEDYYIMQFVINKGYTVAIPDGLYCFHLRPTIDWELREGLKLAFEEIKYGLFKCHRFKCVFYYPFLLFYWVLQKIKRRKSSSKGFSLSYMNAKP
ncbi:MAG: glycosyltransferase family A protein [Candidatus Aenigmatarchaeota archaeon]